MVPGEDSVGTAAPQATSAGGRHLAPAPCGTAPPGLHECFLGNPTTPQVLEPQGVFLPNRAEGGVLLSPPPLNPGCILRVSPSFSTPLFLCSCEMLICEFSLVHVLGGLGWVGIKMGVAGGKDTVQDSPI
uniref:Serine/arginine repetitive matrix 2 n=1 Tax=Molossus molossus TaxID=27622 RepID=A0A7J8J2L3_MOLMO|nr:serine/arginine repetitive matrix 2 [Molossus molossus]